MNCRMYLSGCCQRKFHRFCHSVAVLILYKQINLAGGICRNVYGLLIVSGLNRTGSAFKIKYRLLAFTDCRNTDLAFPVCLIQKNHLIVRCPDGSDSGKMQRTVFLWRCICRRRSLGRGRSLSRLRTFGRLWYFGRERAFGWLRCFRWLRLFCRFGFRCFQRFLSRYHFFCIFLIYIIGKFRKFRDLAAGSFLRRTCLTDRHCSCQKHCRKCSHYKSFVHLPVPPCLAICSGSYICT